VRVWAVSRVRTSRGRRRRQVFALKDLVQACCSSCSTVKVSCSTSGTPRRRELRRQLEGLGDEALILAIEEQADLAKRLKVAFVGQLDHSGRI
jgi:hypothetical protein